jgi:hypothetical protein
MEPSTNYNVILVHGAAGMRGGLDCKDDASIREAHDYDSIPTEYLDRIGGYRDEAWFWEEDFHGGVLYQKADKSGATGMIRPLRNWLTENVFENDKRAVYLQRPFTNPANSPVENGKEIGFSKWQGDNNCNVRRSKIEEAQEVRAKGRDNLSKNAEKVILLTLYITGT